QGTLGHKKHKNNENIWKKAEFLSLYQKIGFLKASTHIIILTRLKKINFLLRWDLHIDIAKTLHINQHIIILTQFQKKQPIIILSHFQKNLLIIILTRFQKKSIIFVKILRYIQLSIRFHKKQLILWDSHNIILTCLQKSINFRIHSSEYESFMDLGNRVNYLNLSALVNSLLISSRWIVTSAQEVLRFIFGLPVNWIFYAEMRLKHTIYILIMQSL
ncbi:hypothetical protein ACJX0J_016729, partial [Zea mays]